MNNYFLNSQQKVEFCELLEEIKTFKKVQENQTEIEYIYLDEGRLTLKYSSYFLAMFSFLTAITLFVFVQNGNIEGVELSDNNFFIIVVAILIPLVFWLIVTYIFKYIRKREESKLLDVQDNKADNNNP